jgi:hypothetical protein
MRANVLSELGLRQPRKRSYSSPAGCLQTTSKLAIIIMSSCSKLWQWKT